eukprot:8998422-Pyramimonas_sp.AAC.1
MYIGPTLSSYSGGPDRSETDAGIEIVEIEYELNECENGPVLTWTRTDHGASLPVPPGNSGPTGSAQSHSGHGPRP